jgi:hypothetical protein
VVVAAGPVVAVVDILAAEAAGEVAGHTLAAAGGEAEHRMLQVAAEGLPRIPHFIQHLLAAQPFIRRPPLYIRRQSIARRPSAIPAPPPELPGQAPRTPQILELASMPRQPRIRRREPQAMQPGARKSAPPSIPVARESAPPPIPVLRELAPRIPAPWGNSGPGLPPLRA